MCGIFGYSGKKRALPLIINGLKKLEYRGYDSSGIAVCESGSLHVYKEVGRVEKLEETIGNVFSSGSTAIGHTRWATHGSVNINNSHPHISASGKIAIVHNGIVENYAVLKKDLVLHGYSFNSDTDTEVLVNFIEYIKDEYSLSLEDAFRLALSKVVGAYAVVLISADRPNTIMLSKVSSPLVVGVCDGEYFVSSDAGSMVEYTKDAVFMNDGDVAIIEDGILSIKCASNVLTKPYIQKLDIELNAIDKNNYPHFMLKEIFEQPQSLSNCLSGRLSLGGGAVVLGGIHKYEDKLANAKRIILLGCGTSWHAGLVAKYFFEEFCNIPVEVEYASEFRYRNPVVYENDVVIAISQSGETADTLGGVELALQKGATVLGVCNSVGSSMSRLVNAGLYTNAGVEIGVASTKAFTTQLMTLFIIGLWLADKKKSINTHLFNDLYSSLLNMPKLVDEALLCNENVKKLASLLYKSSNVLYLGRGYNFPVALEGALKLKEISYIHAEGYPAAEMKHGPIALVDKNMPVIFIANKDDLYDKIVSNIETIKSRAGKVIAVITEEDYNMINNLADHTILVPSTHKAFMPIINVVPLQLLSYHIAVLRGCDVDKPRNLAKSVTVE
jgi:glucosamine--fructose-6-phosphate aminotransferase (isomerizing)